MLHILYTYATDKMYDTHDSVVYLLYPGSKKYPFSPFYFTQIAP